MKMLRGISGKFARTWVERIAKGAEGIYLLRKLRASHSLAKKIDTLRSRATFLR